MKWRSLKFKILPKNLLTATILVGLMAAAGFYGLSGSAAPDIQPVKQAAAGYQGAKVSFSFDDGYASFLSEAAPVLNKYGFMGTAYLTSDYIDSHPDFLSSSEAKQLGTDYQWEIGGHSLSHQNFEEINDQQLTVEVQANYEDLAQQGYAPQTFATPFGAYDNRSITAIASRYRAHRGFHDIGYNRWPYDNYLLRVQQVQVGVSVDTVKGYIDHAIATDSWLILVFHDIADHPKGTADSYQYATGDLDAIASYVQQRQLPVTTVANGLEPPS